MGSANRASTSGRVARKIPASARPPQTTARSSALASPRAPARCAIQSTAGSARFAAHAHSGQSDGDSESLEATAASHAASIRTRGAPSTPPAAASRATTSTAGTANASRRRALTSSTAAATASTTAHHRAVVRCMTTAHAIRATVSRSRLRRSAASARSPRAKAIIRGWRYGSKEFALVRGMRGAA